MDSAEVELEAGPKEPLAAISPWELSYSTTFSTPRRLWRSIWPPTWIVPEQTDA
jgi:hypothetical protein